MFHFSTATYTQSSCCYYEHMHGVVKKQTNRLLGIKRAFFAIQFPSENSTAAQTSSKEISHPNKKSTKMKMSPTTSAITLALALATTCLSLVLLIPTTEAKPTKRSTCPNPPQPANESFWQCQNLIMDHDVSSDIPYANFDNSKLVDATC